jgi:phosphatidylglycerophosphate synthase
MKLGRVLILADESSDWIVAGLRQLERIALAIDEFAVDNKETGPIEVCVFWRPDLDPSVRWLPSHPRLTHVAFTTQPDGKPYDLAVSTRLFLYRKSVEKLLSEGRGSARPIFSSDRIPDFPDVQKHVPPREGAWEQIASAGQIEDIERRFLRHSGKSQDGLVSRYLNRPVSRTITRFLLPTQVTPDGWTWLIFPIPVIAALIMARGTYWSFVWGLILFQVFSILDGCDGEIARAKFLESERGRRLDDLFDVLSNILLVLGVGAGLRHAHPQFGGVYLIEGILAATLIAVSEWYLAAGTPAAPTLTPESHSLHKTLYPRHRALVERSGLLMFGENFASLLIQLTKRDMAVLFFVLLAIIGMPSLILHLVLVVTAVSLGLALKARLL